VVDDHRKTTSSHQANSAIGNASKNGGRARKAKTEAIIHEILVTRRVIFSKHPAKFLQLTMGGKTGAQRQAKTLKCQKM